MSQETFGSTAGGATAANQTTELASLASIDADFPAPAASADATANPTVSKLGTYGMGFNGTTWDRVRSAVTTISSTLTGFVNQLPWALYHATPVTRADTQGGPLETDTTGNLRVVEQFAPVAEDNTNGVIAYAAKPFVGSAYAYTSFSNLAANVTLNVKASAGNVYAVKCHNINAAARYFQLHNTATVPAGSAVPVFTVLVPPTTEVIIGNDFFGSAGIYFSTGIAFAFSTTEGTYTAATSTDQFSFVNYK